MQYPYKKAHKLEQAGVAAGDALRKNLFEFSDPKQQRASAQRDKLDAQAIAERDRVAIQEWERHEARAAEYVARFDRLESLIRQLIKKDR